MRTLDVEFDNTYAYVRRPEKNEDFYDEFVRNALKYRPKGYKYNFRYKKGLWDGWNSLVKNDKKYLCKFKVGLIPRLAEKFRERHVELNLISRLEPASTKTVDLSVDGVTLYPHQADFLEIIKANSVYFQDVSTPPFRGVICSPCGSGKTLLASLTVAEHGRRSIIFAQGRTLLKQLQREVSKWLGVEVGIIGDSEFDLKEVVVATTESVSSILGYRKTNRKNEDYRKPLLEEWIKNVGVVIHDECHLSRNDTSDKIYDHFINCRAFYGFSATPYKWMFSSAKSESILLEQHFGFKVFDGFRKKYNFIDLGLHVPLEVIIMPAKTRLDVYKQYESYQEAIEFQVTSNCERAEQIMNLAKNLHSRKETTFIYFTNIDHSELLASYWDLDDDLPIITGSTSSKEREHIYESVRNKEILTFMSDIGGVGLDIKPLNNIILSSCSRDVRQLIGRVQRKSPCKKLGRVYDFVDSCKFLDTHANQRFCQYKSDKHKIVQIGIKLG